MEPLFNAQNKLKEKRSANLSECWLFLYVITNLQCVHLGKGWENNSYFPSTMQLLFHPTLLNQCSCTQFACVFAHWRIQILSNSCGSPVHHPMAGTTTMPVQSRHQWEMSQLLINTIIHDTLCSTFPISSSTYPFFPWRYTSHSEVKSAWII